MKLSGAQILLESLSREGVDTLFGSPGGFLAPLNEAIAATTSEERAWRTLCLERPQCTVHAADGYSRASGKVGVAFIGTGPEAASAITGIASAFSDSSPLVVFVLQAYTGNNDPFEDMNLTGASRPCAKHGYTVCTADELARIIRQAMYLARSGHPGPVVLDLSASLLADEAEFDWPEKINLRGYAPAARPYRNQLRRAVDMLEKAQRPLLLVGGGVLRSDASEALMSFARTYQIPVAASLMGIGACPGDDPLWLGMAGVCGQPVANLAAAHTDALIAVGTRFDRRTTGSPEGFAPEADIIHLDMEPATDRSNLTVHVPVPGDCRLSLECFAELMEKYATSTPASRSERQADWHARLADWKAQSPYDPPRTHLETTEVLSALNRLLAPDALVGTGVGRHQIIAAAGRIFREPRTFVTPGGFGPPDFGLPATMGAQMACPARQTLVIMGDGAFMRNLPEFKTLVELGLPICVLVLDNRRHDLDSTDPLPNLTALATSFGLATVRIEEREELVPGLRVALNASGPSAVIVRVTAAPELSLDKSTL